MTLKLKDVDGLMLLIGTCPDPKCGRDMIFKKSSFEQYDPSVYECNGCGKHFSQMDLKCFNSAIEQQGNRSITGNRKILEKLCQTTSDHWYRLMADAKAHDDVIKPINIFLADAIIQNLPEIIEAVKE